MSIERSHCSVMVLLLNINFSLRKCCNFDGVPKNVTWESVIGPISGTPSKEPRPTGGEWLAAFDSIQKNFGSFDRYLHNGLKITDSQLAALRDHLLEP